MAIGSRSPLETVTGVGKDSRSASGVLADFESMAVRNARTFLKMVHEKQNSRSISLEQVFVEVPDKLIAQCISAIRH